MVTLEMQHANNLPLRYGMTPASQSALVFAANMANINMVQHPKLRLTQTIGTAKASAGFHFRDGYVTFQGKKIPYCASFDLSVLWLEIPEIRAWLDAQAWWGIAAWYRPWLTDGKPNYHIHSIYAGLPMKENLERQLKDFLNDRTGLKGHHKETFYTAGPAQDQYILDLWKWANKGAKKPPLPPKAPQPQANPDTPINTRYRIAVGGKVWDNSAPAIDGTAWIPARSFFEKALGITKWINPETGYEEQAVKWAPAERKIYVQGRLIDDEVKLMQFNGVREGYLPARAIQEFTGLRLDVDSAGRKLSYVRV